MADEKPIFIREDDEFHFASMQDKWWATETAWYSFHVPERKLGGWLYCMFRPNIGTVAGGCWLWDDSSPLPWEALYSSNYTALELHPGTTLSNCQLPNGVSISCTEPAMQYALGFQDRNNLRIELHFDGVMRPEPLTSIRSTFGKANHFDQFGRITGEISLYGEAIKVDCIGMRDRTWGIRPENRPKQAAYVTGAVNTDLNFLAVSSPIDGKDQITYGFLNQGGEIQSLVSGERKVKRDPIHGRINHIQISVEDTQGRRLEAIGKPLSSIIINRHTFIDNNSLIRWEINGLEGWGEDQDMWPVNRWSRKMRQSRADRTL
jgi:hypothetical protein|tara:strand:- start:1867 stop:2823 length:957 start_codon:yes stop_codon:yes gene_type:complete